MADRETAPTLIVGMARGNDLAYEKGRSAHESSRPPQCVLWLSRSGPLVIRRSSLFGSSHSRFHHRVLAVLNQKDGAATDNVNSGPARNDANVSYGLYTRMPCVTRPNTRGVRGSGRRFGLSRGRARGARLSVLETAAAVAVGLTGSPPCASETA